jgi:hypothetical protein
LDEVLLEAAEFASALVKKFRGASRMPLPNGGYVELYLDPKDLKKNIS